MNNTTDIIVRTEFLRNYLKENELSESQFAEIIGVAHSTVNRILNGKRNPGSKFIAGVLKNFNDLSFEQVFSYEGKLPKGNKNTA
ncbi:helix-turn-helix domain-containing protein [Peribacillus tepidiphilus]|uniref:helix-turn-helix domain-containing protein n=1 Tax=Peribacillus tepidiphilus TaxID=2652445 RepID=UPI001290E113|nr:helix-turn-helix transcriptional regulator [Peribacillus tepidiphilus]